MTLTMESVTALRKLAGRAGAEAQQEGAAQGGAVEQTPQRDGRPAPGNGNKRHCTNAKKTTETQPPNPRPDLTREGGRRTSGGRAEALCSTTPYTVGLATHN